MKLGYIPDFTTVTGLCLTGLVIVGLLTAKIRIHILLAHILYLFTTLIRYLIGDDISLTRYVEKACLIATGFSILQLGLFWYITPQGPYGVGHRVVIIKGKDTSPTVSVFYPIDRDIYDQHKDNPLRVSEWILDGKDFIKGFSIASNMPKLLVWCMKVYKLHAINDEKLHTDFETRSKSLTPVIFSHGLKGFRTFYFSIVSNLVSHGCIVYVVGHTDSTATHAKDYTQDPPVDIYYDMYDQTKHKISEREFQEKNLEHRMKDINNVIDLIKEERKSKLDCINLFKLTMIGHSMGGISAIEASYKRYKDIKLCIAIDPYYFPKIKILEMGTNYALSQPLLIVCSETFKNDILAYDHEKINNEFFERTSERNNKARSFNVMIKNSSHISQCDLVILIPFLLTLAKRIPLNSDYYGKYLELINAVAAFMNEHDFLPTKTTMLVSECIKEK